MFYLFLVVIAIFVATILALKIFIKSIKLLLLIIFVLLVLPVGIGIWYIIEDYSPRNRISISLPVNCAAVGVTSSKELSLPKGSYRISLIKLDSLRDKDLKVALRYSLEMPTQNYKVQQSKTIDLSRLVDGSDFELFKIKTKGVRVIFSFQIAEPCKENVKISITRQRLFDDM